MIFTDDEKGLNLELNKNKIWWKEFKLRMMFNKLGIKLNEKDFTAEMKCCLVKLNKNVEQVRMGPSQVRQGFEKAYRVGSLLGK